MKFLRVYSYLALALTVLGFGAFHLWMTHLANRPLPPAAQQGADAYYFAYGSNMSTRYLYNVRGVLPAQSDAGFIKDYEVIFLPPPGVPFLEPAFAYLVESEGQRGHGVVHRITEKDLKKIKDSEGEDYQWATLPVELKDGKVISARTLVRRVRGEERTLSPSQRYFSLLVEGAAEHGLPSSYINELERQGAQSVYVPVVSALVSDVIDFVVMMRSRKCDSLVSC